MRTIGKLLIFVALLAALVGYLNISADGPLGKSFEAVYEDAIARYIQTVGHPDRAFVAKYESDYHRSKEKRVLTRNLGFGICAVMLICGTICIASAPPRPIG